ncbi:MAG TPA: hypothetical protein VNM48_23070, partial [Chloroflexota bacterium]|nr:hypothetical protein [Chloroflexota bacterium]
MAFRILNQAPAYLNSAGQPLSLGTLSFYANGTLTPKNVYATKALTGATQVVTLDSAGRANTDIWGDGVYRVILKDSIGVTIWDRSDIEVSGGTTSGLPALAAGKFLTNDGAVALWADVRQVPDPTGNAGKQLGTDGTVILWEPKASVAAPLPAADITQDATSLKVKSMLMQTGTDATVSYSTKTASRAVTFPKAYDVAPVYVGITPNNTAVTTTGGLPIPSATNITTTGFTANFS